MADTDKVSYESNESTACKACKITKDAATPLRNSCAGSANSEMSSPNQEKTSEEQKTLSTSTPRKRKKPRRVSIAKLRLPDSVADFIIEAEKSAGEPINDEEYTSCLNILATTKGRREQVKRICQILDIERPKRKMRKSEQVWTKQVWKNAGLHHLLGDQTHTFDDIQSALDMIEYLL